MRKVWHQLRRKDGLVRPMHRGAAHSKAWIARHLARTQDDHDPRSGPACPHDKADRKFKADAPDQRRVADFTYVNTAMGAAYAAFVIDVFARKIFGWRVPTSMTTRFVLYALSQTIRQRRSALVSLTRHPGRGMHCPSIQYTVRFAEAGIDMSVGSIEESCDKFTQSIATRNTIWHFLPASLIS